MSPFVNSSRILEVIQLGMIYNCRPSILVGLEDDYERFCFDEACAFIRLKIENDEMPKFKKKYTSFSDLYKNYER